MRLTRVLTDRLLRARTVAIVAALGLTGCGVSYISPKVSAMAEGLSVRELPVTAENIAFANQSPYAPKALPAVFGQTTGIGGLRGPASLPALPDMSQAAPGALALQPPPPVRPTPYTLGVGDVLRIASRTNTAVLMQVPTGATPPSMRDDYTVRDDGTIAVLDAGSIQVAGLTLDEAEATISQRLIEAGVDPSFSVEIAGFNSKRASVGGAVAAPTVVPITLNPPDLTEVLAAAGGVTLAANQFGSIRIYRDGTLYQIPLTDFYARSDLQKLSVQAGDAIYVDTTYDLARAQAFYESQINVIALRQSDRAAALSELQTEVSLRRATLDEARGNFATALELEAVPRDYIYLAGEVNDQSRWALPFGQRASLADALYGNGGFSTETGNPAQIYVLRSSDDPMDLGVVTAWHLNARNAAMLILATKFEMRPNDIVFIAEQPITSWNRALQQLFPTLINSAARAVN
ncbi:MAG: polysaccharide biosynthesis/export family protein [Alphaproteobacteria bacterium]|nr:polysaccharide biosynthesis/export family protein [Alphaproteobacteria bacterium]